MRDFQTAVLVTLAGDLGVDEDLESDSSNQTLNQALWGSWGQPFQNISDSAQWAGLNKITHVETSLSNYVRVGGAH